ncbi:MAG: S8 family serine peptidase [Candidatus Eisenbacteria bacterium]|nr:S8 family serine peptidase [Candidatus Eisenbacteria bacterium]
MDKRRGGEIDQVVAGCCALYLMGRRRRRKEATMRHRRITNRSSIVITVILATLSIAAAVPPARAAQGSYPCESGLIEVAFALDSQVRLRGSTLVDLSEGDAVRGLDAVLSRLSWTQWSRVASVPEERIDQLTREAENRTGRSLYNPNDMYHLQFSPGIDVWNLSRELEGLPGVRRARPVPLPMAPPTPGDYEPQQGYLRPASATPTGVDADYAWTQTGGTGTGITVCDLEYSWNYLHADLNWSHEVHLYTQDPQSDPEHGTAVLGVMGSTSNGWGTTGISHGATLWTCGTFFKPIGGTTYSWNVPGAIVDAASSMDPGDVLLIEHQWDFGGGAYVPIEWWTDTSPNQTDNGVYDSIEWAIAVQGIHVVEPAGNGNIDLDGLNWFGDSGAIIVGAGGAYTGGTYPGGDLQRLNFSSYGSRVDLQGWGEDVVTTGYGYLYNSEGANYYYTDRFDGTSSASPVVAGALASCAGFWKASISSRFPMPPGYGRYVLRDTGTPQVTPPAGNIGPRPDLLAALQRIREWDDVTSSPLDDTGGFGSWGDYDNDGDLDMYIVNSPYVSNKLLRNDGGNSFTDVTPGIMQDMNGYGGGAVWGDYDNDGDIDLYLANAGGSYNKMFRNEGGGTFTDATTGPLGSPVLGSGPTWLDYDNDGDIDLYITHYTGANKLLRNDGGGNFTDVTSGPEGDAGNTSHAACIDYDNDRDIDIYLCDAYAANKMLRNDNGVFTDVSAAPLDDGGQSTMSTWGDYDNDGDLDAYLVNGDWGTPNRLFRNDGAGAFVDVTPSLLADTQHCSMATWLDADNDGSLDLYLINNQEANRLFMGDGAGGFIEDTHGLLVWNGYDSAVSWGDSDSDGDLDGYFAVSHPANSNTLARNDQCAAGRHWLQVQLRGTLSNRSGIGARVRVVTGRGAQAREVKAGPVEQSLILNFGLGSQSTVDSVIVEWPSGGTQDSVQVAADQRILIEESGASDTPGSIPAGLAFRLLPSAPNPVAFQQPVVIRYELPRRAAVELAVYDLAGRRIRHLLRGENVDAGRHPVLWDGCDESGRRVAPGVYLCRLKAGSYSASRRVMLLD